MWATSAHQKYLTLFIMSWQNGLVYRTSLLLWRFRQFLATMMALTLWNVLFTSGQAVFGYQRAEMTTYVILVSVLQSVILASSLHGLAGEIYSGQITHYLLKPQHFFLTFLSAEAADKLRNLFFSTVEAGVLFYLFRPELLSPSLVTGLIFIIWVVLGTLIHFYISILFGTLGFWSPNTWGPKFLFFMILDFTAGRLFPLDILPQAIQNILYFTPFPYLSYFQIQLFLGRLPAEKMWWAWIGILMWSMITWFLASRIWRAGIINYEANGQ